MRVRFVRLSVHEWRIYVRRGRDWVRTGSCAHADLERYLAYHEWLGDQVSLDDRDLDHGPDGSDEPHAHI